VIEGVGHWHWFLALVPGVVKGNRSRHWETVTSWSIIHALTEGLLCEVIKTMSRFIYMVNPFR
jgi:hypothetical protein